MTKGALAARTLVTAEADPPARGAGRLRVAEHAGVAWDEAGTVVFVGDAGDLPWPATHGTPDLGCIAPGFVDCHTHLPFVGWRAKSASTSMPSRVRGRAGASHRKTSRSTRAGS